MSEILKTWAAVATVLVTATWHCWPYLNDPAQQQAEAVKSRAQLDESLPATKTLSSLPRDPFAPPRKKLPALELVETTEPSVENNVVAEAIADSPLPSLLEGLVLNGTLIQGNSRFAIINQRLVEAGSPVSEAGLRGETLILKQVHSDKVLVSYQGRDAILGYRDLNVQDELSALENEDAQVPQ